MKSYEVELKFHLNLPKEIYKKIEDLGGTWEEPVEQVDCYFKHPVRDFAQTDEALRIRSVGKENRITYKGPVVDKQVKTRQEIEVYFAEGPIPQKQFITILQLLGFEEVRVVQKKRTTAALMSHGFEIEFAFDVVDGLGTFLEIETLANDNTRHLAQQEVLALAASLNLGEPERKSYLQLLINADL